MSAPRRRSSVSTGTGTGRTGQPYAARRTFVQRTRFASSGLGPDTCERLHTAHGTVVMSGARFAGLGSDEARFVGLGVRRNAGIKVGLVGCARVSAGSTRLMITWYPERPRPTERRSPGDVSTPGSPAWRRPRASKDDGAAAVSRWLPRYPSADAPRVPSAHDSRREVAPPAARRPPSPMPRRS